MRSNMKKISNENNQEEPEASETSEASAEEEERKERAREGNAKLLRASLKAASEGIAKGISGDLASQKDGGALIGGISDLILAPLLLTTPGTRRLERGIKGAADGLIVPDSVINSEAKNRLQQRIISPSLQLYGSNFAPLISVLGKIPYVKNLEPNDITNIEAMAIEFKGKSISTSSFSQTSPYKVILKQIIPMLREKFDAVASFDQSLGPGAKIDHEGLAQDLLDGMEIEEDIAELERFYKAISEWRAVLQAFQENVDNTKGMSSDSKKDEKKKDDDDEEDSSEGAPANNGIAENIYIEAVRPGQYVSRGANDDGLFINNHALNSQDTPVVKLYIGGKGADSVNSSGSGEEYLRHFVNKGAISFAGGMKLRQIIYNVTRETVSGGSEITIYFRPDGVRAIKGNSTERVEIMRVSTRRGDIPVFVDDASQVRALESAASTDSTPYYQTVSPGGETVFFTPADLVIGAGRVKDSKGNKFKPKKIKGKSLAQRVMSKGFGEVRRKK
jgi:hypothetical protein